MYTMYHETQKEYSLDRYIQKRHGLNMDYSRLFVGLDAEQCNEKFKEIFVTPVIEAGIYEEGDSYFRMATKMFKHIDQGNYTDKNVYVEAYDCAKISRCAYERGLESLQYRYVQLLVSVSTVIMDVWKSNFKECGRAIRQLSDSENFKDEKNIPEYIDRRAL